VEEAKSTKISDEILPMCKPPAIGFVETFEFEATAEMLWNARNKVITEESPNFGFGAVSDGDDLKVKAD